MTKSHARLSLVFLLSCVTLAGCGLVPAPYVTEVAGPVRSIRVLDTATGNDIPNAQATFESGMGMTNWIGSRPPQLIILPPDSAESKDILASQGLKRSDDRTFGVPRRVVLGLVARGYARQQPLTATITAFAPGYAHAMLEYCSTRPPDIGWSDSRQLAGDWEPPDTASPAPAGPSDGESELVRCDLQKDGVLRFYLRQLTPEMAEAIRTPGRGVARREPSAPVEFAGRQQPEEIAQRPTDGRAQAYPTDAPDGDRREATFAPAFSPPGQSAW
jgi:hypothetical protein